MSGLGNTHCNNRSQEHARLWPCVTSETVLSVYYRFTLKQRQDDSCLPWLPSCKTQSQSVQKRFLPKERHVRFLTVREQTAHRLQMLHTLRVLLTFKQGLRFQSDEKMRAQSSHTNTVLTKMNKP